jgi:hypothetical protein
MKLLFVLCVFAVTGGISHAGEKFYYSCSVNNGSMERPCGVRYNGPLALGRLRDGLYRNELIRGGKLVPWTASDWMALGLDAKYKAYTGSQVVKVDGYWQNCSIRSGTVYSCAGKYDGSAIAFVDPLHLVPPLPPPN